MVGLVGGLVGSVATRRLSVAVLVVALLPIATYGAVRTDAIYSRIKSQLEIAAVQHIGHVKTVGHSYKLLEERFYVDAAREIAITAWTPSDQARYVIKAVASLIAVPLPWQARSTTEFLFLPPADHLVSDGGYCCGWFGRGVATRSICYLHARGDCGSWCSCDCNL